MQCKKGAAMTHILVNHKVKDYTTWKNIFDDFIDVRKLAGEKSYRILHPSEDPNDLTIFFEWDTLENAETFMTSNELKSAMQKGGVVDVPDIRFLDEVDQGTH